MIDEFVYVPKGTCSRKMILEIDSDTLEIKDFTVQGGCPGNLSGIRRLVIGMKADDVMEKLSGTTCGVKETSCPDQLSKALKAYLETKGIEK